MESDCQGTNLFPVSSSVKDRCIYLLIVSCARLLTPDPWTMAVSEMEFYDIMKHNEG